MKTKSELQRLSANIGHAIMSYIGAVAENLEEIGKPVPVQGQDKEVDGVEVSVEFDGQLWNCVITLVEYNKTNKEIMCFCKTWNYNENNEWMHLSELGDAFDTVLNSIKWPKL